MRKLILFIVFLKAIPCFATGVVPDFGILPGTWVEPDVFFVYGENTAPIEGIGGGLKTHCLLGVVAKVEKSAIPIFGEYKKRYTGELSFGYMCFILNNDSSDALVTDDWRAVIDDIFNTGYWKVTSTATKPVPNPDPTWAQGRNWEFTTDEVVGEVIDFLSDTNSYYFDDDITLSSMYETFLTAARLWDIKGYIAIAEELNNLINSTGAQQAFSPLLLVQPVVEFLGFALLEYFTYGEERDNLSALVNSDSNRRALERLATAINFVIWNKVSQPYEVTFNQAVTADQVMILRATNKISLSNGFRTDVGATFNAAIKPQWP